MVFSLKAFLLLNISLPNSITQRAAVFWRSLVPVSSLSLYGVLFTRQETLVWLIFLASLTLAVGTIGQGHLGSAWPTAIQ